MIHCDKCNRSYKNCNFNKHNCNKKEIKFRVLDTWKDFNTNLYKCPECDKKFSKNGLISHFYRIHDERGIEYMKNRKENSKKYNKIQVPKEEISKKISDSLKKAHSEGRHPGWKHVNCDSNKRSYPEKFFINVFENNNLYDKYTILEKHPYGKYFIDFLLLEIKLIIEIDGSQHYRDDKSIQHDLIRDEYFINEGFRIYRIKWVDVCKNADKEINELLTFIENIESKDIRRYDINDINKKALCNCGNEKSRQSNMCISCKNKKSRKVERPNIDTLMNDIKNMGYSATGRKYGVSDNTIRKWIKYNGGTQLTEVHRLEND